MKLLDRFIHTLKPPAEEDIHLQRVAYTLALLIPVTLFFQTVLTIIGFTVGDMQRSQIGTLFLYLLMLPVYFFSFRFYRRRKYEQSSQLIIALIWFGLTTAVFLWRGIQSPIFGMYPLLFLIAALLLKLRDIFILLFITITISFILYGLEVNGFLLPRTPASTRLILTYEIIKLIIVTVTMTLIVHRMMLIFSSFNLANRQNQTIQSQLKEANISLESQSFILQTIIDNLQSRVAYTDKNGRIVFMSSNYADVGIDPQKAIGTPLVDTLTPAQYKILHPYIDTVLSGQIVNWENSIPLSGDAGEIVVSGTYIPHLMQGEVVGYITLARDVTEIRKSEEAIRHGQKLHSLGILAGGIAHDFNNLLVGILGQNSIAHAKMDASHPARKHIDKAIDASEKAKTLIQQMLAYSGRGQFQTRQINLNQLIQTNLRLFEFSIPKHAKIHTHFAHDLPFIEGDAGQLQQVIMNLIINAAQSISAKHGDIWIITGIKQIEPKGDVSFWQYTGTPLTPGSFVKIEVKDNGQGMLAEMIPQIFDPFFTTKDQGSGLGLAAVLGIIRGHRGGLKVKSKLGIGTSFTVLLPAAQTAVSLPKPPEHIMQNSALASNIQRGTILIIDDETAVCATATDILTDAGWQTLTAYSGKEGIEQYLQYQQQIRLVLLDLSMPGMNGEETLHALSQINPLINVILSSGYNRAEATENMSENRSVVGFLQKPYSYRELMTIVQEVISVG